ncbi:hypothetical protein ACTTAL_06465 [Rhodobacter capsulatus]|uniref:hypothetical protein n=1 Tax=Rhodobacter capsulatus TaxID=1061 RepID=UPI00103EF452|nr:hypothetical protein [Rhodobacter capsulatus]
MTEQERSNFSRISENEFRNAIDFQMLEGAKFGIAAKNPENMPYFISKARISWGGNPDFRISTLRGIRRRVFSDQPPDRQ